GRASTTVPTTPARPVALATATASRTGLGRGMVLPSCDYSQAMAYQRLPYHRVEYHRLLVKSVPYQRLEYHRLLAHWLPYQRLLFQDDCRYSAASHAFLWAVRSPLRRSCP